MDAQMTNSRYAELMRDDSLRLTVLAKRINDGYSARH
jgi:hypothetical protein